MPSWPELQFLGQVWVPWYATKAFSTKRVLAEVSLGRVAIFWTGVGTAASKTWNPEGTIRYQEPCGVVTPAQTTSLGGSRLTYPNRRNQEEEQI